MKIKINEKLGVAMLAQAALITQGIAQVVTGVPGLPVPPPRWMDATSPIPRCSLGVRSG